MEQLDALYVIHQDCRLDRLADHARRNGYAAICLLSSHTLFGSERKLFADPAFKRVAFLDFSDLLDDGELESCDVEANRRALEGGAGPAGYWEPYRVESLRAKGEKAASNLARRYSIGKSFVADGLGIEPRPWLARGAEPMPAGIIPRPPALRRLAARVARLKARVTARFRTKLEVNVVQHDGARTAILGSIKRLRIRKDVRVEKLSFAAGWRNFRGKDFLPAVRRGIEKGGPVDFAVSIHGFSSALEQAFRPLNIVVDGFHPPNYTRSYLDIYGDSAFITRNSFDRQWFVRFGLPVRPALPFLEKELFAEASPAKRGPLRVVLLLNHAGDWSALISRSDTDRLVAAFTELSAEFPDASFIVRPHPGMATPEHEGVGSRLRLNEFVRRTGRPNLAMSTGSLEEDLAHGDLFISEYSQTIIDAMRGGKLSLVANLTGRRSYMQCFEDLGFASVQDYAGMKRVVAEISEDPSPFAARQNEAVARYNALQTGALEPEAASRA